MDNTVTVGKRIIKKSISKYCHVIALVAYTSID